MYSAKRRVKTGHQEQVWQTDHALIETCANAATEDCVCGEIHPADDDSNKTQKTVNMPLRITVSVVATRFRDNSVVNPGYSSVTILKGCFAIANVATKTAMPGPIDFG